MLWGSKNQRDGLPGRTRSLTTTLAVNRIHQRDGRTDGRRTTVTYAQRRTGKMIFKYELRFVAFKQSNLWSLDLSLLFIVLVGRNFVSGMCQFKPIKNLKPTNLQTEFFFKSVFFSNPYLRCVTYWYFQFPFQLYVTLYILCTLFDRVT